MLKSMLEQTLLIGPFFLTVCNTLTNNSWSRQIYTILSNRHIVKLYNYSSLIEQRNFPGILKLSLCLIREYFDVYIRGLRGTLTRFVSLQLKFLVSFIMLFYRFKGKIWMKMKCFNDSKLLNVEKFYDLQVFLCGLEICNPQTNTWKTLSY